MFSCRADQNAVAATTLLWTKTVTSATYDAPKKSAALYAQDAVLWGTEVCGPDDDLWGTVSESIRETPQQIYAYFVSLPIYFLLSQSSCALCVVGVGLRHANARRAPFINPVSPIRHPTQRVTKADFISVTPDSSSVPCARISLSLSPWLLNARNYSNMAFPPTIPRITLLVFPSSG